MPIRSASSRGGWSWKRWGCPPPRPCRTGRPVLHGILAVLGGIADAVLRGPWICGNWRAGTMNFQCRPSTGSSGSRSAGAFGLAPPARRRRPVLHQVDGTTVAGIVLAHGAFHLGCPSIRSACIRGRRGCSAPLPCAPWSPAGRSRRKPSGRALGFLGGPFGNAVGAKRTMTVVRHLIEFLDEDGAALAGCPRRTLLCTTPCT